MKQTTIECENLAKRPRTIAQQYPLIENNERTLAWNCLMSNSVHYIAISIGLIIMVILNVTILFWLLTQLNLAIDNADKWSQSLHLIGSILIDGHLNVANISSTMDSKLIIRSKIGSGILMGKSKDYHQYLHQWPMIAEPNIRKLMPNNPNILLTQDNIQIMVDNSLMVRSAADDQLLLLLDKSESKIFLNQVEIRSTSLAQNGMISMLNGSAQMNKMNSSWKKMTITSHTNQIRIRGTSELQIGKTESAAFVAQESIQIQSNNGKIILKAADIHLERGVKTIATAQQGQTYLTVAQLCLCANNGRLFMARVDHHHYKQNPFQCNHLAPIQCAH